MVDIHGVGDMVGDGDVVTQHMDILGGHGGMHTHGGKC